MRTGDMVLETDDVDVTALYFDPRKLSRWGGRLGGEDGGEFCTCPGGCPWEHSGELCICPACCPDRCESCWLSCPLCVRICMGGVGGLGLCALALVLGLMLLVWLLWHCCLEDYID